MVQQYFVVSIPLFAHNGGTYLTKPDAMPPTGTCENEFSGDSVFNSGFVHDERRTV